MLLTLLFGLILGCGQDPPPPLDENAARFPPGFKIENFRWSGDVIASGLIEARNPYGDVRSRTSPDDKVQVSAQIQKLSPDQPEMEIVIEETPQGLVVAVGRAAFQMTDLGDGPQDDFSGRIDLTVLLPEGTRIQAQTVDGLIKIDGTGMASDIVATSRDGDITVVTRGHVQATTGKGDIKVWLGGKSWSQPQALHTTTGKIVVEVLDVAHLNVDAATTGEIRTTFTDGLSPKVERADGTLTVVMGRGSSDLAVRSDRGVFELNAVKKLGVKL